MLALGTIGENEFMQQELSLRELFFALKKRWKGIVVCTLLGAMAAFFLSGYVLPKKYTSSLDLYVNNSNKVVESGNRNQNDLNAAQMLANTYIVILKNPEVLRQVATNMGNITVKERSPPRCSSGSSRRVPLR